MISIKKILFPTDFSSCSATARQYAVFLATRHQAEIHAFHVVAHFDNAMADVYPFQVNAESTMPVKLFDRIQSNSRAEIMKTLTGDGLNENEIHAVVVQGGAPARVILNYVTEKDINLVVMGTHGHTGLSHVFLGSIAERVVRHAACPVLTVREQADPHPLNQLRKILVPTNFSDQSRSAFCFARKLARSYDSHVSIIHVIDPSPFPKLYVKEEAISLEIMPEYEVNSRKLLEEWLKELNGDDPPPAGAVVKVGNPADEISNYAAEQNVDLVVVAARGQNGLKDFLLGSTSEKIVRQAPCPVWTVQPN